MGVPAVTVALHVPVDLEALGHMTTDLAELERRLWGAADELRANSNLTAARYRDPVLGLIFLAFAQQRFDAVRESRSR